MSPSPDGKERVMEANLSLKTELCFYARGSCRDLRPENVGND